MDKAARAAQNVSIIISRGDVYTSAAGEVYFGIERDWHPVPGEPPIHPQGEEHIPLHMAIEEGKALIKGQDFLTDDQGDTVQVESASNKPRDGYQILECEVVRG